MGKLQVRYPFANSSGGIFLDNINANVLKLFAGENGIGTKYGNYNISISSGTSGYHMIRYIPTFMSTNNSLNGFVFRMAKSTSESGYLEIDRVTGDWLPGVAICDYRCNSMFFYSKSDGNGIYGRDYTKIPFYSYETDSTYMFAVDNLNNFFMITERNKIDDRTVKSCSIITRKIVGETSECPLGFYEYNDSVPNSEATMYANLYTSDNLYNAHNVGYCSKFSLYQYTRDGYIYPDIYYCDGGLSVPPDGIVRIGTSKFMRLGSNLFLRID